MPKLSDSFPSKKFYLSNTFIAGTLYFLTTYRFSTIYLLILIPNSCCFHFRAPFPYGFFVFFNGKRSLTWSLVVILEPKFIIICPSFKPQLAPAPTAPVCIVISISLPDKCCNSDGINFPERNKLYHFRLGLHQLPLINACKHSIPWNKVRKCNSLLMKLWINVHCCEDI